MTSSFYHDYSRWYSIVLQNWRFQSSKAGAQILQYLSGLKTAETPHPRVLRPSYPVTGRPSHRTAVLAALQPQQMCQFKSFWDDQATPERGPQDEAESRALTSCAIQLCG